MLVKSTSGLLLILVSIIATAQTTHKQLLDEKKANVEAIMAAFSGKPESFDELIKKGNEGLALAKPTDYEYRFLFHQAIGTGYYYKQDFYGARDNFEDAYKAAVKANLIEKSIKPLGNLVSIYHYMGLQSKADSAAQQLKHIAETVDTLKNKNSIYYNLGLYNQQQKFYYSVALDNFLTSAELYKPIADTTKVVKLKTDYANILMMVSEVYLYLKQPDKALQYLEYVKPYLGLSKIVDITAYGKLIRSQVQLNNAKEALRYYNLLYEAAGSVPVKFSEMVSANLEMASLASKEKNYPVAKTYIDKANKQSKLDNKEILTSSVNLAYGDYFKNTGEPDKALIYYKVAEPGSAKYNKEQYRDLLKSLTALQIQMGNKVEASSTFAKFIELSDSLTDRKISLNLAEMEAIFQNKNKQQQIDTKNLVLDAAHTQKIWLIAGLSLLGLTVFLLIIIYRNKRKTAQVLDEKNQILSNLNHKLEEANQTKAKLFSIISHDLRSPISQVYQFLKLQQLNPQLLDEQQKNELSNQIQTATGSLLETMEDLLLWSKTQMSEFKTSIQTAALLPIVDACKNLLKLNSDSKNIVYKNLIPAGLTVDTDPYYLQNIIRNLLQNAIKASPENGEIKIGNRQTDDGMVIYIKNEGSAFTQQQYQHILTSEEAVKNLNGLGLRLVAELSEKIGASINFKNTDSASTLVEINLPRT